MNNIVVGIGEALWDMLPEGKKIGGAPANFAYHVSQFGFESRAVSAVGNDSLGDEILANFNAKGLSYIIEKVPFPTGTVLVDLDSSGVPHYEIKENVAWDNIPFTSALEALARQTKAVCFGSLAQRAELSRETINKFIDATPADCLKVFDINLRQHFYTKEIIEQSLQKCDILKINDEELVIFAKLFGYAQDSQEDICKAIIEKFSLKMLILTCGAEGSFVFTPIETSFLETPKVEVVDTVGAGDSFTAAFIASILSGKSIAESHKEAVDFSAYVCTQSGAMPIRKR